MSKRTVWITTEIGREVYLSDELTPLGYSVTFEGIEDDGVDFRYTIEGRDEDIEELDVFINRIPGVVSAWIENA